MLTADAIIDERFSSSESIVAQGIRSAMAVPLLSKGQLEAVLFLDSRQQTNAFSEKDLTILSGIAAQAAIALENAALGAQIQAEAITRAELSRFLSRAVAEAVIRGETEDLRQSRLAEVTCLFADIRGFTTLSENESPQEVVSMLNEFFTLMAGVVFRHEGNLDKFIGDCVMAVWGPPSPHPDDPARALRAALEMQDAVEVLNGSRMAAGKPPIEVGIGVNTGQAVVGYMGSSERHEFTAIGDTVNTASRLCGLAKGGEVVANREHRAEGRHRLRGGAAARHAGEGQGEGRPGVPGARAGDHQLQSMKTLNCPSCARAHDVSGLADGHEVACACGARFPVRGRAALPAGGARAVRAHAGAPLRCPGRGRLRSSASSWRARSWAARWSCRATSWCACWAGAGWARCGWRGRSRCGAWWR